MSDKDLIIKLLNKNGFDILATYGEDIFLVEKKYLSKKLFDFIAKKFYIKLSSQVNPEDISDIMMIWPLSNEDFKLCEKYEHDESKCNSQLWFDYVRYKGIYREMISNGLESAVSSFCWFDIGNVDFLEYLLTTKTLSFEKYILILLEMVDNYIKQYVHWDSNGFWKLNHGIDEYLTFEDTCELVRDLEEKVNNAGK